MGGEKISYHYWDSNGGSSKIEKSCPCHKGICWDIGLYIVLLALSPSARALCLFCGGLRPPRPGARVHNTLNHFGGPHGWSKCFGEEKNFLPLPGISGRNIGTSPSEISTF